MGYDNDVDIDNAFAINLEAELAMAEATDGGSSQGSGKREPLPKGLYYTVPPAKSYERQPSRFNPEREVTHYWMPVMAADGSGRTGYVGFDISPVNGTYNGKPDAETYLRAQAVRVMVELGLRPCTYEQIEQFLAENSVQLDVGVRNGYNKVWAIRAVG